MIGPVIDNRDIDPVKRLENLFDWFIEFFKSLDYTCGCPVGNLAQEMGDLSPAFNLKLREALDGMARIFETLIKETKATGNFPKHLDTNEAAYFIISGWHGALIQMKIFQGPEPLENHKRFVLDTLFGKTD